jgi:acyl transferase domain-containing protein
MKALEAEGVDTYLEIGAMPTLLGMGKRCLKSEATWLPSLEKGKDDASTVSKTAESVCTTVERPPLVYSRQAFPWQEVRHPLLRSKQSGEDGSTTVTAPIRGKLAELLSHHIIFGEIVVPGATYLEMSSPQARGSSAGVGRSGPSKKLGLLSR